MGIVSRDRLFAALVWFVAIAVAAVLLWLVGDMLVHGMAHVSWTFLTENPADAGRRGGIASVMVSTVWILLVCLAAAVPVSLGAALYLAEWAPSHTLFAGVVRVSLDVLAGMPSIVFGLFGAALFVGVLGMGFSILAGGLTLACMILPILIRTMEQSLRAVPQSYRLGAAALGFSRPAIVMRVVVLAALPGMVVGLVLGMGRALAETAALIFTSGYVDRMPGSVLDSGRALSVHIFDLAMNVPGGNQHAYASALVLVVFLLAINGVTYQLSRMYIRRQTQ